MKPIRSILPGLLGLGLLAACETTPSPLAIDQDAPAFARSERAAIGINVLLNRAVTPGILQELSTFGTVADQIPQIHAVRIIGEAAGIPRIQALPYVSAAGPDATRDAAPIDPLAATSFTNGRSSWNLDAAGVTNPGFANRTVPYDGAGVYVGVLDSGLLDTWRQYFPQERIAVEYARAFQGGGALSAGEVADLPNQWEHDQSSHGTHVTSTILGYSLSGTPVNGVAPMATVIPVKVLGQNGSGWSSTIAHGIVYIADLKAGALAPSPVVINMSLSGTVLDAVEKAAVDYAIGKGVIIVAAAGNRGQAGMGFPGAYAPVISVAASGWTGQWLPGADGNAGNWWWADDVADPTDPADFYIADFSSRAKTGQDLDVAAPGSWVVGPYQLNSSNNSSFFYLNGTSMAAPHVAGIVALMAQQNPQLTAAQAETTLEGTAIPLPPGTRTVRAPSGAIVTQSWGADATGAGLVSAEGALGLAIEISATPGRRKVRQ